MKHDESVDREPHFQNGSSRSDPSEAKADERLASDRSSRDQAVASQHSVYNEPAMFPDQEGRPIERDWSCSECGYNLRGLTTGHRCPECGHIEVYYPPPEREESYAGWLAERRAAVSPTQSWTAVGLAALACAPFGVSAAVLNAGGILLHSAMIAPLLEEVLKLAAIFWLVEAKPYLLRSSAQITLAAAAGALAFAAVGNLLFQAMFPAAATPTIFAWRWVVCSALHVICTLVAARGVIRVWSGTMRELRPPKLTQATPELILAIILHGAYNATVIARSWPGLLF